MGNKCRFLVILINNCIKKMVTITFQTESNNADLQRILDLARRFKLPFQINEEPVKTKADVLADIGAAMSEVQNKRKNGQKGQSIESFLDEIDNELLIENSTLSHAD
jgi:hypothetical protein